MRRTHQKRKRRSVGRKGGRVKRGIRTKDPTQIKANEKYQQSPYKTKSRPFGRLGGRVKSYNHQYSFRPNRGNDVVEREVVIVEEGSPSYSQSASFPQWIHKAPTHNPWPERVLLVGIGSLSTVILYETVDSRLKQESDQYDDGIDPINDTGMYCGWTHESDGVSQEVTTFLDFTKNGKVYGMGLDKEDGPYRIVGRWKGSNVEWKETYDNFSVCVECRRRQRSSEPSSAWLPYLSSYTKFDCSFVSTVGGITGTFGLKKK